MNALFFVKRTIKLRLFKNMRFFAFLCLSLSVFLIINISSANGYNSESIDYSQEATTSASEIELRERLRHRIEAQPEIDGALEVLGKVLYSQQTLPAYYIQNGFQPLWVSAENFRVDEAIEQIQAMHYHGMNPENYHLRKIKGLAVQVQSPGNMNTRELVDLELLLTDAFLLMASHLVSGQLDPASFDPTWHITRDEADYLSLLTSLRDGKSLKEIVTSLQPAHSRYEYLMDALKYYRKVYYAGGWSRIAEGPTMRLGDEGERVVQLRERLYLAGDLNPGVTPSPDSLQIPRIQNPQFDNELHAAVIRFQNRHGLDADGVVGPRSLAALNTPVETRIRQILINLERWRWLTQSLGENHVLVNIANFSVEVVEKGETVMDMRAIVGRAYRQTPVFSGRMTYLVLSPFWHLPPGITRNDIIPRMRNNPNHAVENNMKIFDGWGANAAEVDGHSVDWSAPNVVGRYRFRQEPGPNNSLGNVKFMFPNPYHVYLHDTPARELFQRATRDFSSGCIRIEKPLELAEYLLRNNPRWNRDAINNAIAQRREQTVLLPEAVMVHILYWTAWTTTDGTIHFRNDIYGRDTRLFDVITNELYVPLTSL